MKKHWPRNSRKNWLVPRWYWRRGCRCSTPRWSTAASAAALAAACLSSEWERRQAAPVGGIDAVDAAAAPTGGSQRPQGSGPAPTAAAPQVAAGTRMRPAGRATCLRVLGAAATLLSPQIAAHTPTSRGCSFCFLSICRASETLFC